MVIYFHFISKCILEISGGIDEPDGVVPGLAVCLLLMWIICYLCIWKGIRLTGKVRSCASRNVTFVPTVTVTVTVTVIVQCF